MLTGGDGALASLGYQQSLALHSVIDQPAACRRVKSTSQEMHPNQVGESGGAGPEE